MGKKEQKERGRSLKSSKQGGDLTQSLRNEMNKKNTAGVTAQF